MHSDVLNHREIFIETNKNPRLLLVASLKFGLALVFIENTVFYLWSQLVFWVKKSVTSWYFSLSLIVQFCLLLHTVHVDESQRFTLCQNIIDISHKCMVEVFFSKCTGSRDTSSFIMKLHQEFLFHTSS